MQWKLLGYLQRIQTTQTTKTPLLNSTIKMITRSRANLEEAAIQKFSKQLIC